MLKSFIIWFVLCFICYLFRTVFEILKFSHNKFADNKWVIRTIYVVMAILWFSWLQMCLVDPIKMQFPFWIRLTGLVFFITGIFLFIFSHIQLRGFKDKGFLVKKGIYTKIRNPMYLGFIIWIISFPIFMQKTLALLSSIIWITQIMIWKVLEEKELEKEFPDYEEYKKRTWF